MCLADMHGFAMNATTGDFNGDGITDLAVSYSVLNKETFATYLGNGDGTFVHQSTFEAYDPDLGQVIVGDFDRDGKLDLAFSFNNLDIVIGIGIVFGNGGMGGHPGFYTDTLLTGDFNNDGILDLAAVPFTQQGATLAILLGNGDGTFKPATPQPPATLVSPASLITGDFNGDGILDLAFADPGSSSLKVLLGNGDGTFVEKSDQPASDPSGTSIVTVDFNGDGKLDLAVVNSADAVSIYLGNGDGTFQTGVTLNTGHSPIFIEDFHIPLAFADFNGDGRIDLAITNYDDNTVSVLLQSTPYKAFVQPPINADGSSIFRANRGVLPVKFTLKENDTPTCALPPATISVTRTAGGTLGTIDESTFYGNGDSGSNFRIADCQYIYNLPSPGVGGYSVDININGIMVGHAVFVLK